MSVCVECGENCIGNDYIEVFFQFHAVYSKGRGNLVLRHFVSHFRPNSKGTVEWLNPMSCFYFFLCLVTRKVIKILSYALCLGTTAKKRKY